jgi:uncharacterized membrane protein YccC
VSGRLAAARGPLLHSAKTFAAGALALAIGFLAGLPHPYWAIITVYVVSQSHAGETRSKAAYRAIGTAVGAGAAAVLVPLLAATPWVLVLALAAWIGLCIHLSLLDRTPRGYVFALSGYTAAIVGFPTVAFPAVAGATALARVQEIVLGVACATLVHSLVLPRSVSAALQARIDGWLADAERWTLDVLEGRSSAERGVDRRRLVTDAAELHLMTTQLPFATSRLRGRQRAVRALEDRMVMLIPIVTAAHDRLLVLAALGATDARVEEARLRFAAWLRGGTNSQRGEAEARAAVAKLAEGAGRDWPGMLRLNLAARLRDLLDIHGDCRALVEHLRAEESEMAALPALPARLDPLVQERARRPLHRDPALAAWSGLAAALATVTCAAIWLATGWPDGPTATVYAAIGCGIFATRDDPVPALATFLGWSLASFPIAALYDFAILPHVHGLGMLVLVLAPALLALGTLYELPRHASKAAPLVFGFLGAVHPQPEWSADWPTFLNGAFALFAGLAVAIVVTRTTRSMSAERGARRIERLAWRELAEVAGADRPPERVPLVGRMLDRMALLTPRLAEVGADASPAHGLDDLRIVLNVAALQEVRARVGGATREAAERLLAGLARHFDRVAVAGPQPAPPELLAAMDDALGRVAGDAEATPADLAALVGIRRTLFPEAPAPAL